MLKAVSKSPVVGNPKISFLRITLSDAFLFTSFRSNLISVKRDIFVSTASALARLVEFSRYLSRTSTISLVFCLLLSMTGNIHAAIPGITIKNADQNSVSFDYVLSARSGKSNAETFLVEVPRNMVATIATVSPAGGFAKLGVTKFSRGHKFTLITLHPGADTISVRVDFIRQSVSRNSLNKVSSIISREPRAVAAGYMNKIFAATVINYDNSKFWSTQLGSLSQDNFDKTSTSQVEALTGHAEFATHAVGPFGITTDWYKMIVRENGLTRVSGTDLANAGLGSGFSSSSLRIFYGGGLPLPVLNSTPRPDFAEIAILVFDGGDGTFDAGDYLLFYGEALSRWRYPDDSAPVFVRNIYSADNAYWLTIAGGFSGAALRMSQISGAPAGAQTITQSRRRIRLESDVLLSKDANGDVFDYYSWYWKDDTVHTASAFTPSGIADPTIDDTSRILVRAVAGSQFMTINGTLATTVNNFSQHFWSFKAPAPLSSISNLFFRQSKFFGSGPYFDYVEIDYLARLEASQSELDISLAGESGRRELISTGFTQAPLTFNLNNPRNPIQIIGGQLISGEWRFEADLLATEANRFYIAALTTANSPLSVTPQSVTDLRGDSLTQVDYFVIAPRMWEGRLQRYIDYRSARSEVATRFVAVEDIYEQFSAGVYNPTAIRDFLKSAYETFPSPPPSTVLFVGDGNYDHRDVLGTGTPNLVPPHTTIVDGGLTSDDEYVYFGNLFFLDSDNNDIPDSVFGVDMAPARWPVRNTTDLERVINKIITYETDPDFGEWRSNVILLADDEFGEFITEAVHVTQTEDLEQNHLPGRFLRDKIYLWDFPRSSLGRRPDVNDAIVRTLNEGALIFNYVGHGNPSLFAHERVFTRQSDVGRLANGRKTPLVFTASCSIGFYDSPSDEGMAEELFRMDGGAIAVVSATRLVFSSANALFNRVAYDHIFGPLDLSVCQAVYAAKLTRETSSGTVSNDRRYVFFGDPYLRLSAPARQVNFTELPDSLVALFPARVSGYVVGQTNDTLAANGVASISVYDSKSSRSHDVLNEAGDIVTTVSYELTGPIIFRGSAPVTQGVFSFEFIPPLDVEFGENGARISVYVNLDTTDGLGVKDSVRVGADITPTNDVEGPQITLKLPDRTEFEDGDPISANEKIEFSVSDTSGVNLTSGLGHAITLTIDNDPATQINLTSSFLYDEGSFRAGTVFHTLSELTPGEHRFKFKAWDNANNSSSIEFTADVVESSEFEIVDLLNYPNPMNDRTGFYFELRSPASEMTLKIFTLSGKRIQEMTEFNLPQGYNSNVFTWDGRDLDGDRVATGVYLYKATAYPTGGGEPFEQFGKIVVENLP